MAAIRQTSASHTGQGNEALLAIPRSFHATLLLTGRGKKREDLHKLTLRQRNLSWPPGAAGRPAPSAAGSDVSGDASARFLASDL